MAVAGAEAWKTRFRERVLDAYGRLTMIVWKLGNARGSLAAPVRAPATNATRARIRCAEQALEDASRDHYAAATLLGGAEVLALRGGAFAPWDPLPSVRRLLDTSAAQREASRKLREARMIAIEAGGGVEKCCVFLLGLRLLLDHPLLPGVDEFLDAERLNAFNDLEKLMEAAEDCVLLVRSARDDVPDGGAN